MLNGLAFLPIDRVGEGTQHLRAIAPAGEHVQKLLDNFDRTYVSGHYRQIRRPPHAANGQAAAVVLRAVPPPFPPNLWNVHDATVNNAARTNNNCEGWNHTFSSVVGHKHPSFAKAVEALQKDCAIMSTLLLQSDRGEPPQKRLRQEMAALQARLQRAVIDVTTTTFIYPIS